MDWDGERAIRTVLVLGGGIVGLSAALAFARALPKVRVTVIDTPPDPAALADRMPGTLPTIARFHAAIGLDEAELVRAGIATHRLGTRFEKWSADGGHWYHCFGETGQSGGGVAFHQLWARARQAKQALPFHCYSVAAALAEAGKFVHPEPDPRSPLASFAYGLRLDPVRYRERLAAAPIAREQGAFADVERRDDGGVAAVLLADGCRFEADLFVDCSGPAAPLAAAVGSAFEDWSGYLPCDRLLLAEAAAPKAPTSCDVAAAVAVGWRWQSPLSDRTLTGLAYAAALTDEGRARRAFEARDAEAITIRPGRRPEPWTRNVLALGDAATAVDPLESANLYLAQSAILRALELLPGRDCNPLELGEYNRRTDQQTARVRDFLALHYLRSPRRDGPLWQAMVGRALPDSLAHTLDQYETRGRLPFYEEESFDNHSWLAVLGGLGVLPRAIDPVAAGIDPDQAARGLRRLADEVAALPPRLPGYADYLARMR